ncbi:hypothetical protein [Methylogaea oryzae]|uniref:hypothetical protein n=1 Tax=Methylogaea oryzae TaxID=1295382 RepID=UPI0030D7E7CF
MSDITIKCLSGRAIEPYLSDLARLRIEVFRDFPYLYDGTQEYEEKYLRTYVNSPDSVVVLAYDATRRWALPPACPWRTRPRSSSSPSWTPATTRSASSTAPNRCC